MPRTKGSKNKKSLTVDYAALIAEKQAEKDAAANEIAAVAANIEELKAELKSKKTAAKKLDKELAKLVAKKAAVEAAAAEAAKRGEAEAMLKKLLAEGHIAAQPAASGGGEVPAHRDSIFLDFGRHLNEVDLMTWLYQSCKLFSRNRGGVL